MLKIDDGAMAALAGSAEAGFRERLAAFLNERFPAYARDPAALSALIDVAVADARMFGFQGERGIAAYVLAAFLLDVDIKEDRHVAAALLESGESEAAKVDWLEGYAVAVAEALEG